RRRRNRRRTETPMASAGRWRWRRWLCTSRPGSDYRPATGRVTAKPSTPWSTCSDAWPQRTKSPWTERFLPGLVGIRLPPREYICSRRGRLAMPRRWKRPAFNRLRERTESDGPGLLFILVALVAVAVAGARLLGFAPGLGAEM